MLRCSFCPEMIWNGQVLTQLTCSQNQRTNISRSQRWPKYPLFSWISWSKSTRERAWYFLIKIKLIIVTFRRLSKDCRKARKRLSIFKNLKVLASRGKRLNHCSVNCICQPDSTFKWQSPILTVWLMSVKTRSLRLWAASSRSLQADLLPYLKEWVGLTRAALPLKD